MKARFIISSLMVWGLVSNMASGQPWIGEAFVLDTSVTLPFPTLPSDLSRLRYGVQDNTLYFAEQKAYQHDQNDHAAHFYALSLEDFRPFEFDLPMPDVSKFRDRVASTYWIQDFSLYGSLCAVSVQDHIILYHRATADRFEIDTLLDRPNVKSVYFHRSHLYYLEEDHDFGYHWFRFDPGTGADTLVRDLPYEAPHVVQASPNRYLFRDENNLYFLSTRFPILRKFGLDGTWMEDITFNLPCWHPFEDEYVRKSLQVPYGVERIFATKDQIFEYSYPKVVFPLGDRYLLYYTQYDTLRGKSFPMYALSDPDGSCGRYQCRCPEGVRYSGGLFPFNVFEALEDLGRTSWKDRLVEITADCGQPWQDLTREEYHQLKESYYRRHDPIIKIRIMRLKNRDLASQAFFYNSRFELTSMDRLPEGRHVFIIHQDLECSACSRFLLGAMNDMDSSTVHIDILYSYIPGALQERELHRNIRRSIARPYDLYYLATDKTKHYPDDIRRRANRYPAVLFYETGKAPILFTNEDIFEDDPYTFRFRAGFAEMLERFGSK